MGIESNLKMIYKGEGAPIVLVLEHNTEDDEIVTECSIKTQNHTDSLDFNIDDDAALNIVVFNSSDLACLLNDIDKSDGNLEIIISPSEPNIQITTIGGCGTEISIEVSQPSDMILSFLSINKTENRYKLNHISYLMKAFQLGQTVSLRTNKDGLLGIQILISIENDKQICIEFYLVPLLDDDSSDEDISVS